MNMLLNPAFVSRPLPHVKTPTAWDPSFKAASVVLSEGDRTAGTPSSGASGVRSVFSASAGKWYWEIVPTLRSGSNIAAAQIGIQGPSTTIGNTPGFSADSYGFRGDNGLKYTNSSGSAYSSGYAFSDVIGVLLDLDNLELRYRVNGVDQGLAFNLPAGTYYAAIGDNSSSVGVTFTANFGQSPFVYDRPWDYWGGLGTI